MLNLKSVWPLLGGVIGAISIALCFITANARAEGANLWLAPSALNLQPQAGATTPPASINGNQDCYIQSGLCAVMTNYGYANTAGAVKLNGTGTYYPVRTYVDNRERFMAMPHSSTVISYTSGPVYGLYLYFNYNFSSGLKLVTDSTGSYYQMVKAPDGKLTNSSGQRLAADTASISFSENGEWMVVSQPNVAMLRVNLQTFAVTAFAPGYDYTIGLNPSPQTAITNDGRYAMVASKDFNRFSIYDINNCSSSICQSRDLQSYMRSQVAGYKFATNLRFISDDTLSFYATSSTSVSSKTAKYILMSGATTLHRQEYLALGDSYISGEGEFDYLPGTDTSQNTCHVSPLSYPLLAAKDLNFNSYHSVACSGATTQDLIDTALSYKGQTAPNSSRQNLEQKNEINLILSSFQQGYIDQLDFVKAYQPQNITVSIGGNDIGFSSILQSCISLGTCYDNYEDRLELVQAIQHQFDNLASTYSKLKNAGAPDTGIYIAGYPQIAKPGGDCAVNVHFNNDELIFADQLIDYLDSVIKAAASKAGVFYVDNEYSLDGHRMCEAGPGSVAMNGLTAGNDFPALFGGPIGRESYHPNTLGHELIENRMLALTGNLKLPMPAADPAASAPGYSGLAILNMPHSGRQVNTIEFDPGLAPDLAYQGTSVSVNLDGADHALAAYTSLRAEIHSTPISLGSFKTDSSGNFSSDIPLPSSVPAGYHTIHFYGANIIGQTVDIYKSIYVAHTADDIDDNNINDSTQACVGLEPSGQDYDKDTIDDACDADITQPPIQTASAPEAFGSPSPNTVKPISSTSSTASSSIQIVQSQHAEQPAPKVLAAATNDNRSNIKYIHYNFRPNDNYLASGSIGFLLLSGLAFFIKSRLF